ncbi:MAG TPA: acetyl-CoA carboxylase biotin carboxyl carrier protein [Negativicutes bacterium]|jgi:acetyl-CoA carboxylase biotin carboxyl carrier protein
MFNIAEIREIIKMIDQSSLQRFELEQEGIKLVIVKNDLLSTTHGAELTETYTEKSAKVPAAKRDIPGTASAENQMPGLQQIVSPVVGTFYESPEPGAQPFVKVAQKVTANMVVCVVEVMKLFNEVEAGINGEIVEILVKDGQFVEYGQPLFLVKSE